MINPNWKVNWNIWKEKEFEYIQIFISSIWVRYCLEIYFVIDKSPRQWNMI
jgi:hypothetical protein